MESDSEQSVRETRSRKRKSGTDDAPGTENENPATLSPEAAPGPLVRSHSSPDILLSDILQSHRQENPLNSDALNRGRPTKTSKWEYQRDYKGKFHPMPCPIRGRPKKEEKHLQQRLAPRLRDDFGRYVPPFDFDNEEQIDYDSDQDLMETETFHDHGSHEQNLPGTGWANVSENLEQLDLNYAAVQNELTDPDEAEVTHPPTLTASEKKIGTVENNELLRNRPIQMHPTDLSCTIWDDSVLQEALDRYECGCETKKLHIGPLQGTKASGSFNGPCIIQCKECYGPKVVIESPGGTTLKKRLVLASIMNGMDYKQLNSFLLTLGLGNIPRSTFFEMRAQMMQPVVEAARQVTAENQVEAKIEYLSRGYELDSDGCVHMAASLDGTWQIKGFQSPTGAVAAIDVVTGKPLDFHVLSKMCPIQGCNPNEEQAIPHECLRNYSGSSGGMEVAGVKEIFGRTTEYGVKIKYMIADGDTKSYREVKDMYHKNPVVDKGECMNHHCKRIPVAVDKVVDQYLNACRAAAGTPKITQKTPPVNDGPRPWGLKKKLDKRSTDIKHLKVCVRSAMTDATISPSHDNSPEAIQKAAEKMQERVLNAGDHCCSDHDECSPAYCNYLKVQLGLAERHREYMPESYKTIIRPALEALSQIEIMKRCVPGFTTNDSESLHNIIWSIVHKAKYHGPRLVWMGVSIGVIRMSDGEGGQWRLFENAQVPLPSALAAYWDSLDKKRVLDSKRVASKLWRRKEILQADLAAEKDNPQYGPGIAGVDD